MDALLGAWSAIALTTPTDTNRHQTTPNEGKSLLVDQGIVGRGSQVGRELGGGHKIKKLREPIRTHKNPLKPSNLFSPSPRSRPIQPYCGACSRKNFALPDGLRVRVLWPLTFTGVCPTGCQLPCVKSSVDSTVPALDEGQERIRLPPESLTLSATEFGDDPLDLNKR